MSGDKRTRSQLTLPALDPSTLGRSPLKDARLALRNTSNSQVQPEASSKLRTVIMDGDATDGDDEILLSPRKLVASTSRSNVNKKRNSEEHEVVENGETRGSKRAKMNPLPPSLIVTTSDAENCADAGRGGNNGLFDFEPKPHPQRHPGPPPSTPGPSVSHINLKDTNSEEHQVVENGDTRGSKRAKIASLLPDAENHVDAKKDPFDFQPIPQPQTPQRPPPSRSVPHINLKNIVASPWKIASPAKQFEKFLSQPKARVATDTNPMPDAPIPPSTPRPAIKINVLPETPEAQTTQGLNYMHGNHGMIGPMSPLTPLPPTPAVFGNTIRAFTAGTKGPGVLGLLGAVQERPENPKLGITTAVKSRSTSPATSRPSAAPLPSTSASTSSSAPAPLASTASAAPKPSSRAMVSNGAGAWGPKPKTPSVLKVYSAGTKGKGTAGGAGTVRVTRSLSMQKMVQQDGGDDKGVAGGQKPFPFTFKTPAALSSTSSTSTNTANDKGKKKAPARFGASDTKAKSMTQMSMKHFMSGTSSKSRPVATCASNLNAPVPSSSNLKSRPSSPTKPLTSTTNPSASTRPAWNAAAGSPSKLHSIKPASSLSTLSIALEKLAMPRPVRPNTSMGFNTTEKQGENEGEAARDDGMLGMRREGLVALGLGVPTGVKAVKRSATVGDLAKAAFVEDGAPTATVAPAHIVTTLPASAPPSRSGSAASGSPMKGVILHPTSSASTSSPHKPQNRPSSIFAPPVRPKATIPTTTTTTTTKPPDRVSRMFGGGMFGAGAGRSVIVIGGGGLGRKASKRTSLPSVMASPVKGGGGGPMAEESEPEELTDPNPPPPIDGDVSMRSAGDVSVVMADIENEREIVKTAGSGKDNDKDNEKDQEKERERERPKDGWKLNASTRASMASQALTQSLSCVPRTPTKGLMGPPRTPVRAASSMYPSVASGSKDTREEPRQGQVRDVGAAKSAPSALGRVRRGVDGHVGASRSARIFAQEKEVEVGEVEEKGVANGTLSVLRECIIFVDVRTDGGDDAGGLFIDMLKGMGAKILTRVGPSCTHIVYKNGLMSTLTRYRMLKDHKPLVVGIGWVVECVEQRTRVDEVPFSVDLDGVNVAGTNKRRRSMLPKRLSQEEGSEPNESQECENSRVDASGGDVSDVDTSMRSIDDEDLPPLEKARRRRLLLTGRA